MFGIYISYYRRDSYLDLEYFVTSSTVNIEITVSENKDARCDIITL